MLTESKSSPNNYENTAATESPNELIFREWEVLEECTSNAENKHMHYLGPKAAYYKLARALEAQDCQKSKRLLSPHLIERLPDIASPSGGMSNLGEHMRQAPDVRVAFHLPLVVDVFATVNGRPMMIQFLFTGLSWTVFMFTDW